MKRQFGPLLVSGYISRGFNPMSQAHKQRNADVCSRFEVACNRIIEENGRLNVSLERLN